MTELFHFPLDPRPAWRIFDVACLLREVGETLATRCVAQGVTLEIDASASLAFCADREMLRRAVVNLACNALDVMPRGGELLITAVRTPEGLELEIADSGPGVDEELRGRLFDPGFAMNRGGVGIELTIVRRIAQIHGGDVEARNCPQGGAAFTICLPQRVMEAAA